MLNNGSSTSAGAYTGTDDQSQRGSQVSTAVGAMVAPSHRGPVNVPTLRTDKQTFRATFGAPDPSLTFAHFCAEQFFSEGDRLYFMRVARNAKYGSARIATIDNFAANNPAVEGFDDPEDYAFNEQDILFLYPANPGNWNNDLRYVAYPDTSDPANEQFMLEIYEGSSTVAVEVYQATLREKLDGYGRQLCIADQLVSKDSRIRARINTKHPEYVKRESVRLVNAVITGVFTYGSDGDAVTIDDIIEGWEAYADTEEITVNLLINTGYSSPAVQLKMTEIAETRGDAFAILDVPSDYQTTQNAVNYRRNVLNLSSSFAALYTPDLRVLSEDNVDIWVPPSGFVAAAYARTDRVAAEWFAPAGVTRGKVAALGIRQLYRQGDRDTFDENQVNFVHKLPNHGLVLWSQDTLQGFKSALSNIHVRRLMNSMQTALKDSTLVGVYEPNDTYLRLELTRIAESILAPIKRGRGLYGYEIICDNTNNTPELIANGDTILDVYVDPIMIAKRIHLNAIVPRTGQIKFSIEQVERAAA